MAVEDPTGPVHFGINSMYYARTPPAPGDAPYAFVHPRYAWPLGAPTQSYPPANFSRYSVGSGGLAYGRTFANGYVVVNPSTSPETVATLPGGPYVDPETNATVTDARLPPQSALILLKSWGVLRSAK